ncbi:hypothetical protein HOD29_05820 [archaeon]|jgi:hypothetical protein|nr:hypothetical protein [archaeon]
MKEIYPKLFFEEFESREKMSNTFMRFYGHYENPHFKGKVFTKKQFERWFRNKTVEGREYGLRFWDIADGFNVPNYVFKPFFEGRFNSLSLEETNLLEKVSKIQYKRFIIVSVLKEEEENLKHELAHGFYYLNCEYKKDVDNYLRSLSRKANEKLIGFILGEGIYSNKNVNDEIHANLLTRHHIFYDEEEGFSQEEVIRMNQDIGEIFSRYC